MKQHLNSTKFVKWLQKVYNMTLEHTTIFDSKRILFDFCNQTMIEKNYFIGEHEDLIKTFVDHYAEGIHSKSNNVPVHYALIALGKLMFEVDKVTRSDNFDSEFASSSFAGC